MFSCIVQKSENTSENVSNVHLSFFIHIVHKFVYFFKNLDIVPNLYLFYNFNSKTFKLYILLEYNAIK